MRHIHARPVLTLMLLPVLADGTAEIVDYLVCHAKCTD